MKQLIVVLLPLLLMACANSEFSPSVNRGSYSPYQGDVNVLSQFPSTNTYIKLGTVTVTGGITHNQESLIHQLKLKAAAHGANAVVINHKLSGDFSFSKGYRSTISGIAILIE